MARRKSQNAIQFSSICFSISTIKQSNKSKLRIKERDPHSQMAKSPKIHHQNQIAVPLRSQPDTEYAQKRTPTQISNHSSIIDERDFINESSRTRNRGQKAKVFQFLPTPHRRATEGGREGNRKRYQPVPRMHRDEDAVD